MSSGKVDAVIVSFNSESHLRACVAAARACADVDRVIVVDNQSSDRSVAVAECVADVVVRMPANVGFGRAQNRGRSETKAPFVLILNPDARIEPTAIDAGVRFLTESPDAGLVQGAIVRALDGGEERWQGQEPGLVDLVARLLQLRRWLGEDRLKRLARWAGIGYFATRGVDRPREVEFLAAVASLARREALDEVGGFDEAFFLYAEDIDLARRLRQAGWRLVALPVPWAIHVGGASSAGAAPTQRRQWWESHLLLVERHWSGVRRWAGLFVARIGVSVARSVEA